MRIIADLHIHSRFARAVSPQMTLPILSSWAKKKGIDIVATGDWTHPIWFRELKSELVKVDEGIYRERNAPQDDPVFLLSTEISSIYSQLGQTKRIHTLVFAPSLEVVEKINNELVSRGANLLSDGRPIVGLSAYEIAKLVLEIDEKCMIIPAHAWTPWFSLYGSKSGFDSIDECFGDVSRHIHAVETGLSSDPAMNWRIDELTNRSIVSFSDAHSPRKLGREATIFDLEKLDYESIRKAIVGDSKNKILSTIEFYPEEGKYHYTGHRKCKIVYSPKQAKKKGAICPVCGKPLTVGVMSRVEKLASHETEIESRTDKFGTRWIQDKESKRPPYVMLVPLMEIISEALSVGETSQKVRSAYEQLVHSIGSEYKVLLESDLKEIERLSDPRIAEGIARVRKGNIAIKPGYDGVFGEVSIWKEGEVPEEEVQPDQETLF